MKYRYEYNTKGKMIRVAKIFSKKDHAIDTNLIDYHTIQIIKKLNKTGHQAYVVGGAIRDILLGKSPKDFDIATNAHPSKIKRIFPSSKIIGKRFRIVLVPIEKKKFIEITTFRSNKEPLSYQQNIRFGSMEEDVQMRDFTCNALYYNPLKEELIDYVNAFSHIKKQKLVPIRTQFEEDPVRMLRALKFSAKCKLHPPLWLINSIRKKAHLISTVSKSRMTEEFMKILVCGKSADIFYSCYKENILQYMMPQVFLWLKEKPQLGLHSSDKEKKIRLNLFLENLQENDLLPSSKQNRSNGLKFFVRAFVLSEIEIQKRNGHKISVKKLTDSIKQWILPITPANIEIQKAALSLIPHPHSPKKPKLHTNKKKKHPFKDKTST